jgi:hypothetical protein
MTSSRPWISSIPKKRRSSDPGAPGHEAKSPRINGLVVAGFALLFGWLVQIRPAPLLTMGFRRRIMTD